MTKKLVLSIDGGGVRGFVPLFFLKYLEEDLLKETGKGIYETFDTFGGTSIGSLIAASIVYTDKKRIQPIIDELFTNENIKSIFSETNYLGYVGMAPKYKSNNKIRLITENLGSKYMSETNGKNTIFALYSIDQQRPKFFKSYKNYSTNTLVSDIVNASSAAPTYFSPYKYIENDGTTQKEHYGIDGAIFANNPTDSIYAESILLYGSKADIRTLSIGTGDHKLKPLGAETVDWGYVNWASELFNITFDTEQTTVDYKMKEFTRALGHKYIRVQYPVEVAIDDVSKLEFLKETGKLWYIQNKEAVLEMITE